MRIARINGLRGALREFGLVIPQGVARGISAMRETLAEGNNGLPDALRPWIAEGLEEIARFKQQEFAIERELKALVADDDLVQRWLKVPGIGLLGASALRAATGDLHRFPTGRHLTPCVDGRSMSSNAGARTRRRSHSPINWLASSGPWLAMTVISTATRHDTTELMIPSPS
jgi:transposase